MATKFANPQVGMNIITATSAQYVTICEVVPQVTKQGDTCYRLRVVPAGYSDHSDRSRWTTAYALVDYGSGWEAW